MVISIIISLQKAHLMSLALRWKKYNAVITKAVNGQEAVDIFEKSEPNSFDAILMDIMMPVMDGIAATKAIRAMERPDADIPIIAMTANAFADDVKRNKEAGMNDRISKPLDAQKINKCTEQVYWEIV